MAINATEQDENKSGGAAALAAAPLAVRREQQFSPVALDETDDAELNDISTILLGSKAITGKAVTAAGQAGRTVDSVEAHKLADEKKRSDEEQATRERMNLAAWNAQKTFVGGVEMTNAEAQAARQKFIDNEDQYAELAVKRGLIREDQQEELKRGMRREKELQEKVGSKTASTQEQAELAEWQQSKIGMAGSTVTGQIHQDRFTADNTLTTNATANAALAKQNDDLLLANKDLFQGAPALDKHFEAAKLATVPLDVNASTPAPSVPQPPRELKASAFGV